jgi:hypothetical protein
MDIIETVGHSLSTTLDTVCRKKGISRERAFREIESFIGENSEEWRKEQPDISYENEFCRLSYVYMNVPIHAYLVSRALGTFEELWRVFSVEDETEKVGICAMGGGPGAELVGVSEFLSRKTFHCTPIILDFLLIDQVPEWDEMWHVIKNSIDQSLHDEYGATRTEWPIFVSRSFLPSSLTDPDHFKHFSVRFSGVDVYILSYAVSELLSNLDGVKSVISYLARNSKPSTKFLFIDRSQREVSDATNEIVESVPELRSLERQDTRGEWSTSPEKFGEWYLNIKRLPRLRWESFFHLASVSPRTISASR